MRKLILTLGLILALTIPAFAQWGGGFDVGKTITHRSFANTPVDVVDTWHATNHSGVTSSAVELSGYNKVRADYDVTGTDVSIVISPQCSNDTLWVSSDSITVTNDSYDVFDLSGCKDYNFYIDSISAGDSIRIYLTPFSTK